MDMIDEELARLRTRMSELTEKVIPEYENKSQFLFAQIMPLDEESHEREALEKEFNVLSSELRMRSDELINIRHQIENLETEKSLRR